jgi:hypothetical protein
LRVRGGQQPGQDRGLRQRAPRLVHVRHRWWRVPPIYNQADAERRGAPWPRRPPSPDLGPSPRVRRCRSGVG